MSSFSSLKRSHVPKCRTPSSSSSSSSSSSLVMANLRLDRPEPPYVLETARALPQAEAVEPSGDHADAAEAGLGSKLVDVSDLRASLFMRQENISKPSIGHLPWKGVSFLPSRCDSPELAGWTTVRAQLRRALM